MITQKKILKTVGKIALGLSALSLFAIESHAQARRAQNIDVTNKYMPGELLIKYKTNASSRDQLSAASRYGLEKITTFKNPQGLNAALANQIGLSRWQHVRVGRGQDLERVRAILAQDSSVERVEYNFLIQADVIPNDPRFNELWGMNNIGQTGGVDDADIDAPEAWDIQTGSDSVVVGVIDSGVDYTHPDLVGNMWVNQGEVPANGIDDDGNGYIDDVHGYDFANDDGDPMDDHGHGTHVAGTIAAVGNNGIGVSGVSWNSKIMAIKFLDASGGGTTAAAISAVTYATDMGAELTNNSWGGGGFSEALADAIEAADSAGSLFIAAAGNSNSNNEIFPHYPSSYPSDNIIAVAALDHSDFRASFSSYGATSVDIAAPGVDILSTSLSSTGQIFDPSGYTSISGTSMATPHVAGAAALVMSQFPELSHLDVKARLLGTARPVSSMTGLTLTGGALNVAAAMEDDSVAPAPVSDLSATAIGSYGVSLSWTASGDDGVSGNASTYDLRYSTSPIDDANFSAAMAVSVVATAESGSIQTYDLSGLDSSTSYFIALKASDNVNNASAISNVIEVATNETTVVYENAMDDISDWVVDGTVGPDGPLWHVSTHRFDSPSAAFYYGVESTLTYDTGTANAGTVTSAPIDLGSVGDASLSFSHFLETEGFSPYDTATVSISDDGGLTWQVIFSDASGTAGLMTTQRIDISAFAGGIVQLRFGFDTLDSALNAFEGWVVDDIEIEGAQLAPVADVGGPYSASIGEPVNFDGSGSSNASSNVYSWDFGDGTTLETDTPFTSHVYQFAGLYSVMLTVTNDLGVSEPVSAAVEINATYGESFNAYLPGDAPESWESTVEGMLEPTEGLFEVAEIDGEVALASAAADKTIHSYYAGDVPVNVSGGYEYTGRMRSLEGTSQVGVTFFSQYPEEFGYYSLKSFGGLNGFHIEAQGTLVEGDIYSFVSPLQVNYEWVRFRIQVVDTGVSTEIRANVWADGTPEPADWQINAYDDAEWRLTQGSFGVWGSGTGVKYWDDLNVESIGDLPVATIVPDVAGLTEGDAEATLLEEAGLTLFYVDYAYDNSGIPAGVVIEQTPAAGDLSFEGSTATLVVSLGPLFYFEVPNVVGFAQADAETEIISGGLAVGDTAEAYSSEVPVGSVISQSPEFGNYLTEGSLVDLTVSLGPVPES